ncbi:MAG: plasmid mobilization relaxosome protein MobC [Lachnospiraceae bacterium]|nr:plasmid mobilization relaxosome protein MobC [Lachnospiraceae bacterium]
MKNRERKNAVQIYLSDDEKTILEMKCKASGRHSLSAFLRTLIVEGKVYNMDYSFMREYNIRLGNASNNINQIAHRIHGTGNVYEADIDELKKQMEDVWKIQLSILSALPLPDLSAASMIPQKT